MKSNYVIVVFAVIILVVMTVLFFELYNSTENAVVERFRAAQLTAVNQLVREIETYLRDRTRGVEVLSSFPSLQNSDMKKMVADIQMFFDYVKKNHVKAISVYDEKGTIIYSTTKGAIGRNYAECDFFQWANKKENKGKQFISSLIRKTDNQTERLPNFRFLIAAPIYRTVENPQHPKPSHNFIGVVTATIDLEEVIAAFLPIASPYAAKENVWITDKNGTLLFQSEHPEMVLRNIHLQDKTCLKCHVSFDYVKTILTEKRGTTEYKLKEGTKKLASFSLIEFKNISWTVVLNIPYEEVSEFLDQNLIMTFILIGVIILTLIGGSSLIYRSNRLKIRAQEEAKQWMEKQKLEDGIRESEKRYRTIIETAHDIVWTLDTQGNFTFINNRGEEITEHKVADLIGKSFVPLIYPDDLPKVQEVFLQTLKGMPQHYDVRVYDSRGNILVLSVNTVPIYQDDIVVGTVSFGRDITKQMQAEATLRQSEEKYRTLINNIQDGVFIIQDVKMQFVNEAFARMVGYAVKEVIGMDFRQLVSPEDLEMVSDRYSRRQAGKDVPREYEFGMLHKDGKTRILVNINVGLVDYRGKVASMGTVKDITERKRAEQEIISQKNKFAQLFENSPIAITLLDDQDKIVHINESFSALFGYYLEEIKGQALNDLIVPPELKEEAESYSDQTRAGNQINKESYRKKKDGTLVYVQIVGVPVIVNDKTVGIYGMYVDLTQRKNAEDKMKSAKELAEQSDKLKTDFLSQMSHEIRTPINVITGNVNLIKDELSDKLDSENRGCFENIELASKRIIRTIDLVLNMSELQTGVYKHVMRKIDIDLQVLKKLFNEYYRIAMHKGVDLIYKIETKEPTVVADEYCVTQIFANLIDNAVKYTKKGIVEILVTNNSSGDIVVEIKDTGIGISKDFLNHIFEPFVQEEQGYTRSYEGNGLGLALVKKYCDINNAIIEVESEKNVGSTFRVIFSRE